MNNEEMIIQKEESPELDKQKQQNISVNCNERFYSNFLRWFENRTALRNALSCLFIVSFIAITFIIFMSVAEIYPFGKYTMSSYDMQAQVAPFIEHFYDVLDGKSSLFYSYSIAGGADVFGTLAYCCLSPFTFIFLLMGKGNVYYGTSFVLPLKIMCVGLSAYFYLRKRFRTLPCLVSTGMALLYSFCGYLFVANTYISWVDLLIYLPWVAYGFYRLITKGKKWIMVLSLCLMIYTCFSITSFSFFMVYPIMILYCIMVLPRDKNKKAVFDVTMSFVITVMFSMPILLPALSAFLVSGRKGGLFENIMATYSVDALYKKITYLVTDGLALFFTFAYFTKSAVKRPIDRFLLVSGLIILVPVFVDESCNLLNMGSYMSYSLRFGFLNGFYFFFVSSLYLTEVFLHVEKSRGKELYFEDESRNAKKNCKFLTNEIISSLIVFIFVVGALVSFSFIMDACKRDVFGKWFSSRFAHSLGGLEAIAIVSGIVAIIALLTTLLVKFKKLSSFIATIMLLVLTCGQNAFYTENLVNGNKNDISKFEEIKVLTNYVKDLDGNDYARIKMTGDFVTADMPFTLHTNAFTVFSSVIDSRNFSAPNFFRFGGNGKNSMKSYNGSFIGDCILGNKYYVTDSTYYKNYLKRIDDENGDAIKSGNYYLYQNTYAFPHAMEVYGDDTTLDLSTKRGQFDSILKILGGKKSGITDVEKDKITIEKAKIKNKDGTYEVIDGVFKVRVKSYTNGCHFLETNFKNSKNIRYCFSEYNEEKLKELKDTTLSVGTGSGTSSVFLKGVNGCNLTIEDVKNACSAFTAEDSEIIDIYEESLNDKIDFKLSPNKITIKTEDSKKDYLFVNYVRLPGHSCFVNGKKVEFKDNVLDLMVIPIERGENIVEIKYSSPYVKYILIGIAIALCFGVLYYLLFIRINFLERKLKSFVFVASLVVSFSLIAFFILMPIGICLMKNLVWGFKAIFKL